MRNIKRIVIGLFLVGLVATGLGNALGLNTPADGTYCEWTSSVRRPASSGWVVTYRNGEKHSTGQRCYDR